MDICLSVTSSLLAVRLSRHRAFGIEFSRIGVLWFCLWLFKAFQPSFPTEAAVCFRVFSSHFFSFLLLIRRLEFHSCHLVLHHSWHLPKVSPMTAVGRFYFAIIMIFYSQIFFLLVEIRYAAITKAHADFRDCSVCFEQPYISLRQLIKRKNFILIVKSN